MKLLITDTETGGIDPQQNSILQLAMVIWDSETGLGAEFTSNVREDPITVNPFAMRVNRLDLATFCDTPDPKRVVSHLRDWMLLNGMGRSMLAGHNIAFDVGFIQRLYRLADEDYARDFHHRTLDVPSLVRAKVLAGTGPEGLDLFANMDKMLKAYDIVIPEEDRHTGLGDARATGQMLAMLTDGSWRGRA